MGGHVGNTRKFIQNPDPQGYIYDANDNVTMGVLPREPVLGETRAWDMKYMLDIPNFECDEEKQADVVQVYCSMTNILMSTWMSGNMSMALWIFKTKPIAPVRYGYSRRMQNYHFQVPGLAIGNRVCTHLQVVKEAEFAVLWSLNKSRLDARCQTLRAWGWVTTLPYRL